MKFKKLIFSVCFFLCISLLFSGCSFVLGLVSPVTDWDNEPVYEMAAGGRYKIYFGKLTNREKHAYNNILNEIENFPERVEIPSMDSDELKKVFEAVIYDNPQLMMIGRNCRTIAVGRKTYFTCDYIMSESEYLKMTDAVNAAAAKLLEKVSVLNSDWEKEKLIHDFIVNNCEYSLGDKNFGMDTVSLPYGALVTGLASCEGYSKAAKLLLDSVGIKNYLLSGKVRKTEENASEDHMWNIVFIDSVPYHMDATWDDPINAESNGTADHTFFNLSDSDISATHYAYSKDDDCTESAANYYVCTKRFFTAYNEETKNRIRSLIVADVNAGLPSVEIKFSTRAVYESALSGLFDDEQVYRILKTANLSTSKTINTENLRVVRKDAQLIIEMILYIS